MGVGCMWASNAALKAALQIAKGILQELIELQGTGHCGQEHIDGSGGVRHFKQYVTKTVKTVVGPIEVRAAQYYSRSAEPSCGYPVRERLGLPQGEYSRGMEELIALAGVTEVYREGLKLLERLTGQSISVLKAETTTQRWGQEAKNTKLKGASEKPQSSRERVASTQKLKGLRMCIATDGGSVQTTECWRDAKLIVSYRFDGRGRKIGQPRYAGTLDYSKDYEPLLWDLMRQTGADRAEHLTWLGDGALWIWNQQQIAAPHAVAIVDIYHPILRLRQLGSALHRKAHQAKQWANKWIRNLYNGKIPSVLLELRRQRRRLGDPPEGCREDEPRKLVADAERYFTNNASRMRYDEYRAKGYPIGSGVVENACRHVVGLRMKRAATMCWQPRRAEAMIQLRCLCAGDEWDRFWGLDEL